MLLFKIYMTVHLKTVIKQTKEKGRLKAKTQYSAAFFTTETSRDSKHNSLFFIYFLCNNRTKDHFPIIFSTVSQILLFDCFPVNLKRNSHLNLIGSKASTPPALCKAFNKSSLMPKMEMSLMWVDNYFNFQFDKLKLIFSMRFHVINHKKI